MCDTFILINKFKENDCANVGLYSEKLPTKTAKKKKNKKQRKRTSNNCNHHTVWFVFRSLNFFIKYVC